LRRWPTTGDATLLAGDHATGSAGRRRGGGGERKRVANLILSHGRRIANERALPLGRLNLNPARLAELARLD